MPPHQNPQLDSADEAETDFDFAEDTPVVEAVEETHPERTSGEFWQSVSKSAWGLIESASKSIAAPTAGSHNEDAEAGAQTQRTTESHTSQSATNDAKIHEIATHAATAFQSTGTMLHAAVTGNMAAIPQAEIAAEALKPLAIETATTAQNVYASLSSAATDIANKVVHQAKLGAETQSVNNEDNDNTDSAIETQNSGDADRKSRRETDSQSVPVATGMIGSAPLAIVTSVATASAMAVSRAETDKEGASSGATEEGHSQEPPSHGTSKGGSDDSENSSSAKPAADPEGSHGTAKGGSYYSESSAKTDSDQESRHGTAKHSPPTDPSQSGVAKAGYHDAEEGSAAKEAIPGFGAEQTIQPGIVKDHPVMDEARPPSSKLSAVNAPPNEVATAPAPRVSADMNYPAMDPRRPPDRNEIAAAPVSEAKPSALESVKATAAGVGGDLPTIPRSSSEQQANAPALSSISPEASKPRTEFGGSRVNTETASPIADSLRPQPTTSATTTEARSTGTAPIPVQTTVASIGRTTDSTKDQTAIMSRASDVSRLPTDKIEPSLPAANAPTTKVADASSTAPHPQLHQQAQLQGRALPTELATPGGTMTQTVPRGNVDVDLLFDRTRTPLLQTDGRVAPATRTAPSSSVYFSPSQNAPSYLRATVDFGLSQRGSSNSPVTGADFTQFSGRMITTVAPSLSPRTAPAERAPDPSAGTRTEVTTTPLFQIQVQRTDARFPHSMQRQDIAADHAQAHAIGRQSDGGRLTSPGVTRVDATTRETAIDVSGKLIDGKSVRLLDIIRSTEGRLVEQGRLIDQGQLTRTFDMSGRQVRTPGYQGTMDARLAEAPLPMTRDFRYTNNGKRYLITEIGLAFVLAAGGIRRVLPSDKMPSGGNSNDKRRPQKLVQPEKKQPVAAAELSSKFNTPAKLLFKSALLTTQRERTSAENRDLNRPDAQRVLSENGNSVSFLKNVAAEARKALQLVPLSTHPYRLAADGLNGNFVDLDDPFLHESNAVELERSGPLPSRRKQYERSTAGIDASDVEQDDHSQVPRPAVLTRPTWLIAPGETLVSIAENHYSDPNIAWLIAELNREQSDEHWIDGKCIIEFNSRQQVTLPVWQDVEEFYSSHPGPNDPENLITIVKTTKLDRDVVENALSKVMGTTLPSPASVSVSGINDTHGSIEELTLRANISI